MIENNNPELDTEQLIKQIQHVVRQEITPRPCRPYCAIPYVPPKVGAALKLKRKIKEKIRAMPIVGGIARWAFNVLELPDLKRYVLGRLDHLEHQLDHLEHQQEKAVQQLNRLLADFEYSRGELAQQSGWLRQELHRVQRRLNQHGAPVKAAESKRPTEETEEDKGLLDAYYLAFEDTFRGSRSDIKSRLEVYLPYLHRAGAGTADHPVLDIGCGRGEWLDLLKDKGLVASGIDLNGVMVDLCRDRDLDVESADALGYLAGLPDSKLGAVTGFHIIEHLSFEQLLALFDETLRVLNPGGIAILETPNPENLMVGALNFYNDPTHRNPLPPQVVSFMAGQRGFAAIEILRLHPCPAEMRVPETSAAAERINQLFYGPQDYAVIATKSHAT